MSAREAAALHLEGANLHYALLQFASLRGAHLEGTNLASAHLEGAMLRGALLGGISGHGPAHGKRHRAQVVTTSLRFAHLDSASNLRDVRLGDRKRGFAQLSDVHWNGADITRVRWSELTVTGDEQVARDATADGVGKMRHHRLDDFLTAVRGYRQLATITRSQGLAEEADRFAYRAQVLQRDVLRRQGIGRWPAYVGSTLLDVLAGYGFRPGRSILVYLTVIVWFANLYAWAAHGLVTFGLPPSQLTPLPWYEALVLSVSSFHGRGFFQPLQSLGDPVAILAAGEAVFGLIIEVSFIATFTNRFFAR
jgi:hypothetical protein